ncbi:MAG: MATE family efflux transporter [Clostridia bacterium]|nr:MATE family efflux transporter [Clostridia bacterium]
MQEKINKMGVKPVGRLMLSMGIPLIISMIIQAFYNIVDSYFVAKIEGMGDVAMNALTLAFPVQMLMIAIGVGTGVGINAVLSRSLGAGDKKRAGMVAGNAVFLGICSYVIFLLFGLFGVSPYLKSQTDDLVVLGEAQTYLKICSIMSFGAILYMIYEKLLQGTGKTVHATVAMIIGAVTNIILDPVMIFGLWGFPKMGVAGAAWATVIGQCLSCALDMVFHYFFNREIESKLSYLKPDGKVIADIYKVGLPAIIMQALMSVMTYGVNVILKPLSQEAVTAYGVYYKIQQFALFAAFGLNNAQIPIVAFNYGMRDKTRLKQGMVYGFIDTVVIMLICAVVFFVFASSISGIFDLSEHTMKLCESALKTIVFGYIFMGANISFQGIFQALGKGVSSLILSIIRLVVPALPLLWLFASVGGEGLIWWAFPISEAIATCFGCAYMFKVKRDLSEYLKQT